MTEDKDSDSHDDDAGYGVLHRNRFFRVTPLTGWVFVNDAKKLPEILFWYCIIILFLVITAYNLSQLIEYHASKPTKTNARVRSTTEGLHLPNITLQLKVPLEMIRNAIPTDDIYLEPPMNKGINSTTRTEILEDYLCRAHKWRRSPPPFQMTKYDHINDWSDTLVDKVGRLLGSLITTIPKKGSQHRNKLALSDPAVLNDWMEKINQSKNSLATFWEGLFTTPADQQNKYNLITQLNDITNGLLEQQSHDNDIYKLLIFEAYKYDGSLVKEMFENTNSTLNDLFADALMNLGQLFHLDVKPPPELVALVDYSTVKSDHTDNYLDDDPSDDYDAPTDWYAVLKLLVVPKEGTKSVKLSIYFFIDLWLRNIHAALEQVLEIYDLFGELICYDLLEGNYNDLVDPYFYSNLIEMQDMISWNAYVESELELLIGNGKVSSSDIEFATTRAINVAPYLYFSSQIDICSNDTFTGCIGKCTVDKLTTDCACLPWQLSYLHPTINLCQGPCDSAKAEEECFNSCSNAHQCQLQFTNIPANKLVEPVLSSDVNKNDITVLDIRMPEEYSFAQFTEEYEFTNEEYLSILGGTLESLSGVSILGAIHLVLFILVSIIQKITKNKSHNLNDDHSTPDINTIEEEFEEEFAAVSELSDAPCRLSRFLTWLRGGNIFFEQTPIGGFGYIATTDSVWDAIFWYLAIFCFLIMGSFNISIFAMQYAEKPTQTTFVHSSKFEDLPLPNFTINVYVPVFELGDFKLSTYDTARRYTEAEIWDYYLERHSTTARDIKAALKAKGREALKNFQLNKPHMQQFNSSAVFSPEIFAKWQESLASARSALEELKENEKSKKIKIPEILADVPRLVEAPLKERIDKDLFLKLILLEAVKRGKSPKQLLQERFTAKNLTLPDTSSTSDILKQQGWTMEQLVQETLTHLSQLFHVSLDSPSATAMLTDCSVDIVDSGFGKESGRDLRLEFEIGFAEAIQQVELAFDSYMYLWLKHVLEWSSSSYDAVRNVYFTDTEHLYTISMIMEEDMAHLLENSYIYSQLEISQTQVNNVIDTVDSGSRLDIDVKPIWQTSSQTDDCIEQSLEWCKKECILQSQEKACGCYPWFMGAFTGDILCGGTCNLHNQEACSLKCNPCDRQALDLQSRQITTDDMQQKLFKVYISIPKDVYPKLLREYEMSVNEFIAKIGALCDFWMGLNILALIHLFIFIAKTFSRTLLEKIKPINKKQPTEKLAHLKKIRIKTMAHIRKLQEATVVEKVDKPYTGKTFDWLFWHNNFFEQTDLGGFSFISAAATRFEAAFWWLLGTAFVVMTFINVTNEVLLYTMKPTKTILSFSSNETEIQMPNFTLNLATTIDDLFGPQGASLYGRTGISRLNHKSHSAAQYFLCVFSSDVSILEYELRGGASWNINRWKPLLNSSAWNVAEIQNTDFSDGISEEDVLANWFGLFESAAEKLYKFLQQYSHLKVERQTEISMELLDEFNNLLNVPIQRRFSHAPILQFLLLQSLKSADHPKELLYQTMNNWFPERPVMETNAMDGIDAKSLYNKVLIDLSQIIHIESNPPTVKAVLKDWDFDTRDHQIQYDIVVPAETNQLTLEIRYFRHVWWGKILETFKKYFEHNGLQNQARCPGQDMELLTEAHTVEAMLTFESSAAWLNSHQGMGLSMDAMFHHEYGLKPITQFYSETADCYRGSFHECQGTCMAEQHLTRWGCVPWTMLYVGLDQQRPVCTEPCLHAPDEKICKSRCEKMHTACKASLYEMKKTSESIDLSDFNSVFYSVTITKEQLEYAVYTEQYSLPFGTFIVHLAGLLEIWLGLNLFSILHLMHYIFKQAYFCRNRKPIATAPTPEPVNNLLEIQKLEQRVLGKLEILTKQIQAQIIKEENGPKDA